MASRCVLCDFWVNNKCIDPIEFVRSDTGEDCCRHHTMAVPSWGLIEDCTTLQAELKQYKEALRMSCFHKTCTGYSSCPNKGKCNAVVVEDCVDYFLSQAKEV